MYFLPRRCSYNRWKFISGHFGCKRNNWKKNYRIFVFFFYYVVTVLLYGSYFKRWAQDRYQRIIQESLNNERNCCNQQPELSVLSQGNETPICNCYLLCPKERKLNRCACRSKFCFRDEGVHGFMTSFLFFKFSITSKFTLT